MANIKPPSPKPMPTTGRPDRMENDKFAPPPMNMRRGMSSSKEMPVNPGRKGDE